MTDTPVSMGGSSRDSSARDLIGYGESPPDPKWPGGARLALNIVINYEEGGERSIVYGDERGETHLTEDIALASPPPGQRLLAAESIYEYGSRVGIWRLMRLLTERRLRATVWAVGQAVQRNPLPVQAM